LFSGGRKDWHTIGVRSLGVQGQGKDYRRRARMARGRGRVRVRSVHEDYPPLPRGREKNEMRRVSDAVDRPLETPVGEYIKRTGTYGRKPAPGFTGKSGTRKKQMLFQALEKQYS